MKKWPGIRGSDGVEMVEDKRQEASATGGMRFRASAALVLGPGLLILLALILSELQDEHMDG